ncbi:hypothetical protein OFM39_34800, partial [Escherichia coli]|nr:hypothetical protein [Escherichia coli]
KIGHLEDAETKEEKVQKLRRQLIRRAWEWAFDFLYDIPFRVKRIKLIQHPVGTIEGGLLHLNHKACASMKFRDPLSSPRF